MECTKRDVLRKMEKDMSLVEELFGNPGKDLVNCLVKKRKAEMDAAINIKLLELQKHIIPLYKIQDDDKSADYVGTGFLLQYPNEDLFLFTCGHVVDQIYKNETEFEIWLYHSGELRQINHNTILTISKQINESRNADKIDFASYKILNQELKEALLTEYRVIDAGDVVDLWHPQEKIIFAALGFPESKNKVKYNQRQLKNIPYAYKGCGVPIAEYKALNLDPLVHVAFRIDFSRCRDDSQNIVQAPPPNGISGGPIFPLYSLSNSKTAFIPSPLAGITSFYMNKEKIIYGAKIAPILKAAGDEEF